MHTVYHKVIIYALVSILISLYFHYYVDIPLHDYIASHRSSGVENIFNIITEIGNAKYAYGIILICFIIGFFIKNKAFAQKAKFAFISMLTASVIVHIGKISIGKSRPKLWIHEGKTEFYPFAPLDNTYDYASMPSGHTQVAFTFAILLSILFPKYRYIYVFCAMIVGLSRVMISAHWLSDVVMGAMFGAVVPVLIYHHFYKSKF